MHILVGHDLPNNSAVGCFIVVCNYGTIFFDSVGIIEVDTAPSTASLSDELKQIYSRVKQCKLYAMVKFNQDVHYKFLLWMDIMDERQAQIARRSKRHSIKVWSLD